jgi:cytoskeletal protein CcmA (bactofilin family)
VSKSRKVSVVDGYSAVKAAAHAVKPPDQPEAAPAVPAPPEGGGQQPPGEPPKLGSFVGRTVMPVKRVIECYECGYKFQLHGKAATTNCSKCRAILDLTDHVIDSRWAAPFKTAGVIHLTPTGVLQSGDLIANDLVLEGTIEAGTVRLLHKLEIRPGARFSEQNIQAPELVIAPGATIAFIDPAEYRDVEIFGALRANLTATGTVTIHAGGSFEGQLQTAHLIVEDGGGLVAEIQVGGVLLSP